MRTFDDILFWRAAQSEICREIERRDAVLKIVVKAKDEKHFLSDWVSYHSSIVGPENLILFDNMSTDLAVAEIYNRLPKEVMVVRYDGFHNNIHDKDIFSPLYAALAKSCRYFLFIDTDEFVTLIDQDTINSPSSIVKFLSASNHFNVFPGTWLYNAPLSRSLFRCGSTGELDGGLRWGKPIVRSTARTTGTLLHNSQIAGSLYDSSVPLCFFILHMLNLYPDQRVAVNLRKMAARGLISSEDTTETVLARDWEGVEDNIVKVYVSELKAFSTNVIADSVFGTKGLIEIKPNARIEFPTPYEEQVFNSFRAEGTVERVLALR